MARRMRTHGRFTTFRPRITAPAHGATVDPVHAVTGDGARPGATVELHPVPGPADGRPVATTIAAADGSWAFAGDTPVSAGIDMEWYVTSRGMTSAHVAIHVAEEAAP